MDNDDNDYQGQGLHLVGEESSKVSPVLRPYTLPKFDFDVGHIRFDSLVENEVFLGIPSQEDNQWIEDFSRGSSGLEFSSGAADSCSIPRHNNVWSEATSLETVEMLLKSVGQEEMVPGESAIQDSDGGGELPSLTKQMDDRIENVKDANSVVTPVEVIPEFSGMDQNPDVDDGQGKHISEAQRVDQSAYGPSGTSSEEGGQAVTKVNSQVEMSYDENQKETCTIVNESLRDQTQDDPSIPVVEVQDAESLVQDASLIIGKANDQIVVSDLCHENATTLTDYSVVDHDAQDDFPVNGEKFNEGSAATCAEDPHPPLLMASSLEMLEKRAAAEVTTGNLQEPSSLIAVENSNLPTGERPIEKGSFADNREDDSETTHAKGAESSINLVETPVLSGSHIESSEQGGQSIIQTVDPSVLKQSPISVGNDCGVITPGLEDRNEIAVIHCEDAIAADVVPAHAESGSAYICEELSSSKDVHVHDCGGHGVVIHEKGAEEMPSDTGKLEHDFAGPLNGEKMAGSSLGEVAEGNVETTHGSGYDASSKDEKDSNLELKDNSNVSPNAIDGAPVDSAALEVLGHDMEKKSDQHEQDREMQMEALKDAKMSSFQVSGDEASQQCPDSGSKIVVSNNTAVEEASEVANQPANLVVVAETSVDLIEPEQVVDRASVEFCDKIELSSIHLESNVKMKEAVEAIDVHKDEEPPKKKNLVTASSEVLGGDISAEVEKPNDVSESVDTGPGLPQSNMDEQAGVKDGKIENVPLSDSKELVAGKASLNPMPPGVNVASEEEKSFTFDVSPLAGLPEGGTNKGQQSSPHTHSQKRSVKAVDASPSTPGSSQKDPKVVQPSTSGSSQRDSKVVQEISHESQQTPGKGSLSGASKGPSDRRSRRGSAKSGKENARKGTSVKETVPLRQSEIGDRLSVSMGSSGSGLMQLDVGSVERGVAKAGGMLLSVPGSSLPDLNTSTPISLLFQQPFTDLQQVQLRAQIFVYGSLIQGVAPDEACMISAFGISDGGRSLWEPIWRACLERLHGQKSHPSSSETPARSGSKASDQANKQGSSQSKVVSTPAGRVSSKSTPAPVVNPMIPLSSPLWNLSTPSSDALPSSNLIRGTVLDYPALSPLHAYPPSTVRNYATHTSSWPSQTVFPGSWVSSAQSSAVDARLSSQPVTETLKLTPIKESSVPISSAIKNASHNLIAHSGGSGVFSGAASLHDVTKASTNAQQSTDKKSRKRKKASASEDPGQITVPLTQTGTVSAPVTTADASKKAHVAQDMSQGVLVARNDTEVASHSAITSHFSTSVAVPTPSKIVFKSSSDKPLATVSPVFSNDHTKVGDSTFEKKLLKPQDIAKVEEAKLQAEEAAGHAAIAVTHCQNVWCQLDKQKNSGLMSDVEAKVSSAAVAIAASASIAKAAAAAAKIASNVALQAKLMVDEALISNGTQNSTQSDSQSLPSVVNMGNATSASILKARDENSSIIFAAREAARRKIEAASAASRHAENLEAIVKAAELASEAVSQAGKVVAMGDPLPIAKLVEAGPEDFLKGSKSPSGQGAKSNNILGSISNVNGLQEASDAKVEQSENPSDKELHTRSQVTSPLPKETSRKSLEDQKKGGEGISASVTRSEKDLRGQKNRGPSDLSKTSGVVPESENISRSVTYESIAVTLNDTGIKEGCLVEVFKDNGDFAGAWFSANVLSLKGGKASVCYSDLESAEGSGKLKEWVPLEAEGSKPPRVRIPHPMTSVLFEGARKRRRADARDYTWSIGDRVDAWTENGWREGVILEKNQKDESTLSIHFPAQGKTSVVQAWHLRPTLTWKDGEWIEWSNFRESLKGDTPQEKRLKVGSPSNEGKGKGKVSKNVDFSETGKPEESRLLPLSANEKIFDIGSTRNENKPQALRTMRSGLQKEGSKVIFGVPKPGKKRKFMEVSKHYVSDRNSKSNNAHSDSEKFTKYLMPQGSGSRGWKNNSKVDLKEKPVIESNKPKGLKSGKHPNLATRTLPQKDNSITSSASSLKDTTLADSTVKDATSNADNETGQQNLTEFVSASNNEEAAEEQTLLSLQAPHSDAPRKSAKTNVKSERLKKGKVPSFVGRLTKADAKDKTIPETAEPRRSNRRIQPTSRLLEGLQSSLIIPKFPSVSHDKNQKTHSRGLSRGNN